MRHFAAIISLVSASLVTSPACAGSAALGNITQFTANQTVFFLVTNGTRSGAPACAAAISRWAIDISTNGGQAMAALVMSAQAQGKLVSVIGNGTCSVWGDTETADHIDVPTS